MARPKSPKLEIAPAWFLQHKHNLFAENRPEIRIDPAEVPEHLRFLIPIAERWGIGDDIIRGDYMRKQPQEDVRRFYEYFLPHREAVSAWVLSLSPDPATWPSAAVPFLVLLEAHDEAYEPTPKEAEERQCQWESRTLPTRLARASAAAAAAFRRKDYREVISLLTPFEKHLGQTDTAKLSYARRHMSSAS